MPTRAVGIVRHFKANSSANEPSPYPLPEGKCPVFSRNSVAGGQKGAGTLNP